MEEVMVKGRNVLQTQRCGTLRCRLLRDKLKSYARARAFTAKARGNAIYACSCQWVVKRRFPHVLGRCNCGERIHRMGTEQPC
ncbi:unnamed protein product [Prunus brigantina]